MAILVQTFKQWRYDETAQLAGALAYFAVLSLAPLLLISMAVVGYVTEEDAVKGEVYNRIEEAVGTGAADMIQDMVRNVNQSQSGGLAAFFGVATLIYGAISIFVRLQSALNQVWDVRIKDDAGILQTIKRRAWSGLMLPVSGAVILLALIVDTGLSAVTSLFEDEVSSVIYIYLLQILSFLISVGILTFLFAAIYKILPDVEIGWEDVWIGSVGTAVLFSIGQVLLSFYLSRGSVGSTYGAAGTFMVVLLWVYYSAHIFILGAEFTQAYAKYLGRRIEPAEYAYRVARPPQPAEAPPEA